MSELIPQKCQECYMVKALEQSLQDDSELPGMTAELLIERRAAIQSRIARWVANCEKGPYVISVKDADGKEGLIPVCVTPPPSE